MTTDLSNVTAIILVTTIANNVTIMDESLKNNVTNMTTTNTGMGVHESIKYIAYITFPLLCIVGLIGNTLTLIILSSKHFRSSTTFVYLSALAVSDNLFLVMSPFTKQFINKLIGIDIKSLSRSGCKAFFCFYRLAKLCSCVFVVVMSIERFIVIWFPLRAKLISTKSSAIITVCTTVVAAFILFGFWTTVDELVGGHCIPNYTTPETKAFVAALLMAGMTLFNIIPPIILLVCTPLTIFKLYRSLSIRRSLTTTGNNTGNDEVVRITKTMLCIMIAYIILVTPSSAAHCFAFFNGDTIFESTNPDFIYFRELALMMESMNYSVNFFLYVVTNKTFRKKLFLMISYKPRKQDAAISIEGSSLSSSRVPVSISTVT